MEIQSYVVGFVLALFQSTTTYKPDSEHTRDYRMQNRNITSNSK